MHLQLPAIKYLSNYTTIEYTECLILMQPSELENKGSNHKEYQIKVVAFQSKHLKLNLTVRLVFKVISRFLKEKPYF